MEQLIKSIHEIIGDYRIEDKIGISENHITKWIKQFDEGDREFVLQELLGIFEKRYISKEKAREIVSEMIVFLAEKEKYTNAVDFLKDCYFIDHQPKGKSQKVLLNFLDEFIQGEFGISLAECNSHDPKFFVYFDDILCTGDTVYKGLGHKDKIGWYFQEHVSGKSNLEHVIDSKYQMIWAYFAVHEHGRLSAKKRLFMLSEKKNVDTTYVCVTNYKIDNNFETNSSSLQFLWPLEEIADQQIKECENHILGKVTKHYNEKGWKVPKSLFYRPKGLPVEEKLFSSAENRIRFEKIMLKKCIEVYDSAGKDDLRMRPLGYGLISDVCFGFGGLIFTWRNVAFNVPMIFWYGHHGWIPLFNRKFVNYKEDDH